MDPSQQNTPPTSHTFFIARTLIFIKNNNRFLLIKGSPDKNTWPNLFNAIGGHIEKNESIIESAFREIFEETNLSKESIHNLHLIGIITISIPEDSPNIILFIFSGISSTTNVKESTEGSLHWLTPNEISDVAAVEDIPLLIEKILQSEETNSTFIGHYHYDKNNKLHINW
jgi:8-oxo-dGTP pyrophosphatase MutT (NUDIX family)